jgi:hypothetical protein
MDSGVNENASDFNTHARMQFQLPMCQRKTHGTVCSTSSESVAAKTSRGSDQGREKSCQRDKDLTRSVSMPLAVLTNITSNGSTVDPAQHARRYS